MKTGILLHVYHLEVVDWVGLVWGNPKQDKLGTLTKFADCLLDIPANEEVVSVIYSGPSGKDGLSEGAYARKYLVDRIDHLRDFPRLRRKIEQLSAQEHEVFVERLHALEAGPLVGNTLGEIEHGATHFAEAGADKVIQIMATSHAPRCVKLQAVARENGLIADDQRWFVVMSDIGFAGGSAAEVVIREPAHRADDPLLGVHPSLSDVLQRFQYELRPQNQVEAVRKFDQVVTELAAEHAPAEAVLETS